MASAAGVALVMLQALVLGNQWVVKWMFDHEVLGKSGAGYYLRGLIVFPHWRLTPTGGFKYMAVTDFTLLVLLVALAAFSALGLMTLDATRSAPGALICGWWATLITAAFTGFFSQVLAKLFLDVPPLLQARDIEWAGVWVRRRLGGRPGRDGGVRVHAPEAGTGIRWPARAPGGPTPDGEPRLTRSAGDVRAPGR